LVWRYASEHIEKDVESLETESMEEWIRQDKIIFPIPMMKKLSSGKRWTNC